MPGTGFGRQSQRKPCSAPTRQLQHTVVAGPLTGPEAVLALQRSVGNQAVTQLLASARPIQRFIENDAQLMSPGKVSEGGELAVAGRQEAYASTAAIQAANQTLGATPARVRIEQGAALNKSNPGAWTVRFGANTALYRLLPVFSGATLTQQRASTQPAQGDTNPARQAKLQLYKDSLSTKLGDILRLRNDLEARWKVLDARWFPTDTTPMVIWSEFNGLINGVVQNSMGAMWVVSPEAKVIFGAQTKERNELTLKQHQDLFAKLAQDYMNRLLTDLLPETTLQELWPTLPNDCKNAAMILTGKDETQLNQRTDNPAVGGNYGMALGEAGHVPTYGWATHYATVIANDAGANNTDNVTFETAANINAGMTEGKTLGFFEMYGTANPVQTFVYTTLRKNRDNIVRQANVDLQQARTAEQRAQITRERDEDLGRIDLQIAARTPLPPSNDDDL